MNDERRSAAALAIGKLLPFRRGSAAAAQLHEDPALSDAALLAACGTGDRAALGVLFDRHHEVIYRFLARYLGAGSDDLDDLVQSTFLTALGSAARFRGGAAVRTWLIGIAINLARHQARSTGRRQALLHRVTQQPQGSGAPLPDATIEQRELVQELQAALLALPEDLRAPFVLCELEDLPCAEAAEILGIREGTLWRRLHDARKRLRADIERADSEGT